MHRWFKPFWTFVWTDSSSGPVLTFVFGCLLCLTRTASAQPLILRQATDSTTQEALITVPDSEDSSWSFQWFVDGKAVTPAPISRAGQLVVYLDKVSPGREYTVLVYKDATTLVSQPLSLDTTTSNNPNNPGNGTTDTSGGPGVG